MSDKKYTEDQIKEAYEIVYGHDEDVEYEYSQNGCGKVYMHSVWGSNYVDMSHHIDYLIRKGIMEMTNNER